jgi:hydrogenase maturation factor
MTARATLPSAAAADTRELTFFTDIDHVNHEAIAAVDQRDDSIVAVARHMRDATRADVAEFAIEVADASNAWASAPPSPPS